MHLQEGTRAMRNSALNWGKSHLKMTEFGSVMRSAEVGITYYLTPIGPTSGCPTGLDTAKITQECVRLVFILNQPCEFYHWLIVKGLDSLLAWLVAVHTYFTEWRFKVTFLMSGKLYFAFFFFSWRPLTPLAYTLSSGSLLLLHQLFPLVSLSISGHFDPRIALLISLSLFLLPPQTYHPLPLSPHQT